MGAIAQTIGLCANREKWKRLLQAFLCRSQVLVCYSPGPNRGIRRLSLPQLYGGALLEERKYTPLQPIWVSGDAVREALVLC